MKCAECGTDFVPHYRHPHQKYCRASCRHRRDYRNNVNPAKLRMAVVSLLGGKCARCGFGDVRALHVDHVDGGGSRRRASGETIWRMCKAILAGTYDTPVRVLCANCNWITRLEQM